MSTSQFPLVLSFGHKAQNGKDTAAAMIMKDRGHRLNIKKISFAAALRKEVHDEVLDLRHLGHTTAEGFQVICRRWNAEYDPNAPVDAVDFMGKQRDLLQKIGNGRRIPNENYWTDKWQAAVAASGADVVIVTDTRYTNEANLVKSLGGYTIKFTRVGFKGIDPVHAAHISENALNDYAFDVSLNIPDGDFDGLRESALATFDALVQKGKRTF